MPIFDPQTIKRAARSNTQISGGEGVAIDRVGQSLAIGGGAKKGGIPPSGTGIFAVTFVEEFDNHISAYKYDWKTGLPGETLIYVAKPPQLRRDFYEWENESSVHICIPYPDGTYYYYEYVSENERTAYDITPSGGGAPTGPPYTLTGKYQETQRITPSYYVGEVFYVFGGATGLTVTVDEVEQKINLTELPGVRVWARTN